MTRETLTIAERAGITEEDAMARVRQLLEDRIIRQVTPIFDTRALGYSSMLVAAKVDPENPWRAAQVINEIPASHTTTCATTTSTSGSRSRPSRGRRSGSRARSRSWGGSRAPSRSVSCRR